LNIGVPVVNVISLKAAISFFCYGSRLTVANDPAIGFGDGRNLGCCACNENLICGVKVKQAQISFQNLVALNFLPASRTASLVMPLRLFIVWGV